MFGHHMRVFGFAQQVLAEARKKPVLFAPLVLNVGLAVPVNAVLIVLSMFLSDSLAIALLPVGLSALYFIDYFCGGLNTAMVYEQQTTGNATLGSALKRTLKSSIGILVFAVVSGLLDFAVQILSQRRFHMLRPVLLMIRSFWSTATFVIMPTMVIEGLGFGAAFKRSKELAEKDPTQIGVGYIGIGLVTSLISLAGFLLTSFVGARILMPISPLLGLAFSLVVVNATWAIAAYLKSTYYTCFYMWTRECERNGGVNPAFAPAPLRNALAGVDFASMGIQLAPAAAAAAVAVAVAGAPAGFPAPQPAGGFAAPQAVGFAAAPQGSFGAPQQGGFGAPPQGGFGAPQQGGFGAPPPQPAGFGAPAPQPGGFTAPQPGGFTAPAPQPGGFTAPAPQPGGFTAPAPQPGGFTAPAPQPGGFTAPAPQPGGFSAPAPGGFSAPQPVGFAAPQPQGSFAPAPQPHVAPAPQPYVAPAPQPYVAPAPQPYVAPAPRPYAQGPAPQPYPQPAPQMSAPAPRPYAPAPVPAVQASAPAPRPHPQPSAPAPQPQPYASGPAPQPYPPQQPYPQPQPYASGSAPSPQAFPSLDSPDLQDDATVVQPSPFDNDVG